MIQIICPLKSNLSILVYLIIKSRPWLLSTVYQRSQVKVCYLERHFFFSFFWDHPFHCLKMVEEKGCNVQLWTMDYLLPEHIKMLSYKSNMFPITLVQTVLSALMGKILFILFRARWYSSKTHKISPLCIVAYKSWNVCWYVKILLVYNSLCSVNLFQ